MSTHKKIDRICIAAILLTLAFTVLFMNGRALGIEPIAGEEDGNGLFTANDRNGEWDTSSATKITLSDEGSRVSGNGAYVYDGNVHIIYAGCYVLTGGLTDGTVIIDADKSDKIWIMLDEVSIHCEDDAAIRIEQADKVFLTLAEETENMVSSGAEYKEEVVSAGVDGAIYSRDDLTINGTGALTVTAEYHHGIVCNDDLAVTGGKITIRAVQDGIHANDSVRIREAAISVSAGDDGITVSNDDETAFLYVESGNIVITDCYEGMEAVEITIAGGIIDIASTDDGINANGSGKDSVIRITGGDITIANPSGRDADGLDSNGDIYIEGGRVFISVVDSGGNCAIDYGSENGGTCIVNGGTVIACGSSMMAEGFDSGSAQGFLMYNTAAQAGAVIRLKDSEGKELLSEEIPYSFSLAVISAPGLELGDACTITVDGASEQVTVDNRSSSGFGMGRMAGGGMGAAPGDFGAFRGGEAPGEMERPEDMEPPEGMERPGDMEAPEGMEFPEGMEAPEGMEVPEDMEVPDGNLFTPGAKEAQRNDIRSLQQERGQMVSGNESSGPSVSKSALALVGVSVLVLLVGLAAAVKARH